MSLSRLLPAIVLCAFAAPAFGQSPNNDCLNATPVSQGSFDFDNSLDTLDGPIDCDANMTGDVWFLYTPSATGIVRIETCNTVGTLTDSTLIVYDTTAGCPISGNVGLACDDDSCGPIGFNSSVEVPVIAGNDLLIQVGGWDGSVGTGTLDITLLEFDCADGFDNDLDGDVDCLDSDCTFSPACNSITNDECIDAIAIGLGDTSFNNIAAFVNGPDDCDGNMSADVWFEFTAPSDGSFSFGTCGTVGSLTNTVLIVYDGAAGCPTSPDLGLACDDNSCGPTGQSSEVNLTLGAGETVIIQVGGFNGSTGVATLTIEQGISAVTGISCTDNGSSVDVTWNDAIGGPGAASYNVYVDGVLAINVPVGTTNFTTPYPPGGFGVVSVCVETVFGTQVSVQSCCTISIPPVNDLCVDAITIGFGDTLINNSTSTNSGPFDCDANMSTDLWYEYTSNFDGDLVVETCNTVGTLLDTTLIVYDGSTGCPTTGNVGLACDDDTCGLNSRTTVPVGIGDTLLIQVGGWNGSVGNGTLSLSVDCGTIGFAICVYDLPTDTLTIDWVDNPNATMGYEILENGVVIGTVPPGVSSFQFVGPTPGYNTYEVSWTCVVSGAPGPVASCFRNISGPVPPGITDLILHQEGLENLGALGNTDSGMAIESALNFQPGTSVFRAPIEDFDLAGLVAPPSVERIWVAAGTFPFDYGLTQGEGNFLRVQSDNGIGLYFEASDHWGFAHVPSSLDDIDGINENFVTVADTFDAMDAVSGNSLLDLSLLFPSAEAYAQDSTSNDWTGQLVLATTDVEVVTNEAIWTNNDNTGTGEPPFITGVAVETVVGSHAIFTSWEFGGFGGDQNALMSEYLAFLGGGNPFNPDFIRGDANNDGSTNIADAIFLLGVLFPTPGSSNTLACEAAADTNNDGFINIADAIFLLGVLFPGPGGFTLLDPPAGICGLPPGPLFLSCLSSSCPP